MQHCPPRRKLLVTLTHCRCRGAFEGNKQACTAGQNLFARGENLAFQKIIVRAFFLDE
jgi:hypothetical protein